jgi:hypothetical protein
MMAMTMMQKMASGGGMPMGGPMGGMPMGGPMGFGGSPMGSPFSSGQ